MKGIILAGGAGTRLYPLTIGQSKHLLPVHDRPMIYFPLSTLMVAGIRDILIVSTPESLPKFEDLLGDGGKFGIKLSYIAQPAPEGIVQGLLLGRNFIGDDACGMALGDNLFYGEGFGAMLRAAVKNTCQNGCATVFACRVNDTERFGIVELDEKGRVISLEEKPEKPKSSFAVTGLYFYPPGVSNVAERVKPSARGEMEITDLNALYLEKGMLDVRILDEDFIWYDMGTMDELRAAVDFACDLQENRGFRLPAPDEIARMNGWIQDK